MAWANPPKIELGAPVRVSPFIRFCRWGALAAGIAWGINRQRSLSKKETAHRVNLRQKKIIWEQEQAIKKQVDNRTEMLYMAKETGTPIPATFDQQYPDPRK